MSWDVRQAVDALLPHLEGQGTDALIDVLIARLGEAMGEYKSRNTALHGEIVDIISSLDVTPRHAPYLVEAVEVAQEIGSRRDHSAYYTPTEVVDFVLRAVDVELSELDLEGLADRRVSLCDPACGSGAFLVAARERGCAAPQLTGFEVRKPAARLAAGLSGARIEVADALADAAPARRWVDGVDDVGVVVGNPPWRGHSRTRSSRRGKRAWIAELVDDWRGDDPRLRRPGQAKWLQDDYVRFLRLGQWMLRRCERGVLAFVTNHAWLDNPTFRGMRQHLLGDFCRVFVLDLHGNVNRNERVPDDLVERFGHRDQGVFSIRQGAAVAVLVKGGRRPAVLRGDLWGARSHKLSILRDTDPRNPVAWRWRPIEPQAPAFRLAVHDAARGEEYRRLVPLDEIFGPAVPGLVTTHDSFAVAFDRATLAERIETLCHTHSEAEARRLFRLCSQGQWSWRRAVEELPQGVWREAMGQVLYHPFDVRWTCFDRNVVVHSRARLNDHLLAGDNIALCTVSRLESAGAWEHAFVSALPVQHHTVSTKEITYGQPLYRVVDGVRTSNVGRRTAEHLTALTGAPVSPEMVLGWVYGVLWSAPYRERYRSELRDGLPRVPMPVGALQLRAVSQAGWALVQLHLKGAGPPDDVTWEGPSAVPTRPQWTGTQLRFGEVRISGITARDRPFSIGHRPVLKTWLRDRARAGVAADPGEIAALVGTIRQTQHLVARLEAPMRDVLRCAVQRADR